MAEAKKWTSRKDESRFRNPNPAFMDPAPWDRVTFVAARTWTQALHPRSSPLVPVGNDGRAVRANGTDPAVTWIGHATFLIQMDGINVLTDPHWSDRASPVGFAGPRRLVPPGLRFEDLPPIHLVLISHDHYDHLDLPTIRRLAVSHRPRFLVPLGLARWFDRRQVEPVRELDWWESEKIDGCLLTCLPAQHFSGRTLWDHNRRLWCGWAIHSSAHQIYFAGDTGYDRTLFDEIARCIGPVDLAALPIGAYLPPRIMQFVHSTPEQAVRIFSDLRAGRLLAMHWGTFDLAEEPLGEPPKRLEAEAARLGLDLDRIWILRPGETRGW